MNTDEHRWPPIGDLFIGVHRCPIGGGQVIFAFNVGRSMLNVRCSTETTHEPPPHLHPPALHLRLPRRSPQSPPSLPGPSKTTLPLPLLQKISQRPRPMDRLLRKTLRLRPLR